MVGDGGFEPPKRDATDLQSAPFDRSGNLPFKTIAGAGEGTWTPDLLITNQLLYQLSYTSNWIFTTLHSISFIEVCVNSKNILKLS